MTNTARITLTQADEYLGSRIGWKTFDDRSFEEDKLTIADFSPARYVVAAGSEHREPLLWDMNSRKCVYNARNSGGVESITFDPDGRYVAVGSLDGSISVLDLETKMLSKLSGEDGVVSDLLYIAPTRLLSAAWDGSITTWNSETHSKIKRYSSPNTTAHAMPHLWHFGIPTPQRRFSGNRSFRRPYKRAGNCLGAARHSVRFGSTERPPQR